MGVCALPTKKVGALLIWEAADMSHACGPTVGTVTEGRERAGAAGSSQGHGRPGTRARCVIGEPCTV